MPDYVRGTLGVIARYIENSKDDQTLLNRYCIEFINTLYHFYFYFQSDLLYDKKQELYKMLKVIQPLYDKFKSTSNLTNDDVIRITYTDMFETYNKTRMD